MNKKDNKRCPLMVAANRGQFGDKCMEDKCLWYYNQECVILFVGRNIWSLQRKKEK